MAAGITGASRESAKLRRPAKTKARPTSVSNHSAVAVRLAPK